MSKDRYFVLQSHTVPKSAGFEAYNVWDIKYGDPEGDYTSTGENFITPEGHYHPNGVSYALNSAVERGKEMARREMRLALGLTDWGGKVGLK